MTDFGILYRTEMVKAILAGLKTQTRRPAWKLHPCYADSDEEPLRDWPVVGQPNKWVWRDYGVRQRRLVRPTIWQKVRPGDRLWVRETWFREYPGFLYYKADGHSFLDGRWKPNIHMFRRDSRITQIVTAVRIERVQEISEDDAIAEGMGIFPESMSATKRFWEIWEAIHGRSSWQENPEVVVITYRNVFNNIDEIGRAA